MKKKKPETEDIAVTDHDNDSGASPPAPGGGGGMARFILMSVLLTTLVTLLAGAGLGWLQFVKQQELSEIALAGEVARQNATLVGAVVKQSEALADHLAGSEVIRNAVLSGRTGEAGAIASQMVLGGKVVLVPADSLQEAEELSFSARDLILKARRGETPLPVFLPGDPPTLLVARAMPDGAVLLLQQRLKVVSDLLGEQDLQGGWVTIQSKDNQTLFSAGSQTEGQTARAPSMAGATAVAVMPPRDQDPGLLMLYLLIAGGMVLLVILVIISTLLSIGRGIKKDAALLANLASDLTQHGQASTRAAFTFKPLELVTASIRKLAEQGGHAGSRPARRRAQQDDEFVNVSNDEMAELTGDDDDDDVTRVHNVGTNVADEIFREYDVRGTSGKTLTADVAQLIGRAVGTECLQGDTQVVLVARDGRLSSPELAQSLIQGLRASGRDVVDLGAVPTPLLYYALKALGESSAVMVTGSHNPPEYNGFKIVVAGETLHGDRVRALHTRIVKGEFSSGEGKLRQEDVLSRYLKDVTRDIVMARPMKVVLDTANGIAGSVAPGLFRQLGCEVTTLFEEVDGRFPNHAPDTSKPESYAELIKAVKAQNAELGIAFDGDADRLGVVTPAGEIIWADRLMMLFARDLLTRSPGADVLFDVKCTSALPELIREQGGRPVMTPSGHSLVKAKLHQTGASLAGEMSGHIFFADRWNGYDDGFYAAARLLEILSLESGSADEVFAEFRTGPTTPEILLPVDEQAKFALVRKLQGMQEGFDGTANTMDGLRVDYPDGWGLVRASNTSPALVARFEGRDEAALARIKDEFREALQHVAPSLAVPF